ncbi:MAG: isoprenylcysteine carboxylmethyltransferase family protein, partial [Myxococcota bacterium]
LLFWVRPTLSEYLVGLVAVLLGAALRTWGAGHLVKTTSLTISGPYAWVRHPLYVGTLLCGSGIAVMFGGWWALGVLAVFLLWFFLVYFPRKERLESARLEALYGEAFARYRSEVPALRPRLATWRPSPQDTPVGGDPSCRWSLERYSENNELGTLLALLACMVVFGVRAVGWT